MLSPDLSAISGVQRSTDGDKILVRTHEGLLMLCDENLKVARTVVS